MFVTGTRNLSPYMLMMPLMMIMMMVSVLASGGSGGKKVPEINADRKEYLRYLAGLRSRVTSSAAAQVAFFGYHAPNPDDLLSIVGTPRQWSRTAMSDFYAATRIGIGDQPVKSPRTWTRSRATPLRSRVYASCWNGRSVGCACCARLCCTEVTRD